MGLRQSQEKIRQTSSSSKFCVIHPVNRTAAVRDEEDGIEYQTYEFDFPNLLKFVFFEVTSVLLLGDPLVPNGLASREDGRHKPLGNRECFRYMPRDSPICSLASMKGLGIPGNFDG